MTIKIEVEAADPFELHRKLLELLAGSGEFERRIAQAKRVGRDEYMWREETKEHEGQADHNPMLEALRLERDTADEAGDAARMGIFDDALRFLTRVLKEAK